MYIGILSKTSISDFVQEFPVVVPHTYLIESFCATQNAFFMICLLKITSNIFSNFVSTVCCNATVILQNHNIVQMTSGPLGLFKNIYFLFSI